MIKIAILEDIEEVAVELRELFNDELDMMCERVYHNAEDAIPFIIQNPVDIVVTDIGLPGMNGIEAMHQILENQPQIQFCLFTVFEDNKKIFDSIKAGAKGYILKNSDPATIVSAVRDLFHGGSPMNPEIARKVLDAFIVPEKKSEILPLTKREKELLDLLSQGLLYKEIATALDIKIGTVKQHIHNIYDKLQVNNRTEAINRYLKR